MEVVQSIGSYIVFSCTQIQFKLYSSNRPVLFFPKSLLLQSKCQEKKNSLTNMKKKDKCLMKMMSIDPDPAE